MNRARNRTTVVVDPRLTRQDTRDRVWSINDYITVPVISTYGTFNFGDHLSDSSIRNLLTAYSEAKKTEESQVDWRKPSVSRFPRPRANRTPANGKGFRA